MQYFARKRSRLEVKVYNSATADFRVFALVTILPFGRKDPQEIYMEFAPTGTTRTEDAFRSTEDVTQDGEVIGFQLGYLEGAGGKKRGQTFCVATLIPRGPELGRAYLYAGKGIGLGEIEESLSGKGFLSWIQLADDAVGTGNTISALGVAGARRVHLGFLLKYHSDATVQARTLQLLLREVADDGGPTGFSIPEYVWGSAVMTLTADEEGILHVGAPGFVSFNDQTTITYADNSTAPAPFPYWSLPDDTADIVVLIGNGQAGDDYDFWALREEWIEL